MRIGLCDFNRTELKAFLYKENSSFTENLGVFFHRIIYLIPTGTWMNSKELISRLENNDPEAVESVFKNADVNQSVRWRIDQVFLKIFNTKINNKIDQINQIATHPIIHKYDKNAHEILKAIYLANRGYTPVDESEIKLLNDINLDNIKPFLENLAYFDEVIQELRRIGIDVSSDTLKKNIGKTKAEITALQKHLIMDHYGDFKVIQSYIDPLLMHPNLNEHEKKALSILAKGSETAITEVIKKHLYATLPSLSTKLMPIVREELALLTGEFNEPLQSFVQALKNETALDESALFDFIKENGSLEEAASKFAKTPFNHEPFLLLKAKRKQELIKKLSQPVEFYEGMKSPLVDAIRETHAGKTLTSDFLKSWSPDQIQKELTEMNYSISTTKKGKEIIQSLIDTDLLLKTTKGKDFDFLRILKVIMLNDTLSPLQVKYLKERIQSDGSLESAIKNCLSFNPTLRKDQIVD